MTVTTKYGKITATPDMLNMIGIAFNNSAHLQRRSGFHALADESEEINDCIYKTMDEAGEYDDFR